MIENILISLSPLQLQPQPTAHPYITSIVTAAFVVAFIAIGIQFVYALIRKKFTDINKLSSIMKEVTEFNKRYMDAFKKQDKKMLEELNKKKAYIDKLRMDMFRMNTKPMMIFLIPSFILWIYILPNLIGYTSAVSPISLNVLGDLMPLTCTKEMIINDINNISDELNKKADEIAQGSLEIKGLAEKAKALASEGKFVDARSVILDAYDKLNAGRSEKIQEKVPRCTIENEVLLWAWYLIVSVAFGSIVTRITKTNMPSAF
ncbi:MAG: EMC3/TMCO1 family protein [Candidatus Nitrosocaldaceae archaeon]